MTTPASKSPNGYEHEYRTNGVNRAIFSTSEEGRKVTLTGFEYDRHKYESGHRLLVILSSGQESRYKIVRTSFPSDVKDQYFLYCEFDPRNP